MFAFFEQVSKINDVFRWSGQYCIETETVKSHSYDVAVLAHLFILAEKAQTPALDINVERAVLYALYHDASESLTSDLPSPVKYANSEIEVAFKHVEALAEVQLLNMLPPEIGDSFKAIFNSITVEEKRIVKAADTASAYFKARVEVFRGNRDFKEKCASLEKFIEEFNCNTLSAFCDAIRERYKV